MENVNSIKGIFEKTKTYIRHFKSGSEDVFLEVDCFCVDYVVKRIRPEGILDGVKVDGIGTIRNGLVYSRTVNSEVDIVDGVLGRTENIVIRKTSFLVKTVLIPSFGLIRFIEKGLNFVLYVLKDLLNNRIIVNVTLDLIIFSNIN